MTTSRIDTLARCHGLALAAMRRAADVAVAPARPATSTHVPAAPPPAAARAIGEKMITEFGTLAMFTEKARARIFAVLDRLPD